MIRVQTEAFDVGNELAKLKAGNHNIGGIAVFVGTVRDVNNGDAVSAMTLEHYPGMTEKSLVEIEKEALSRWPLDASLIVHRVGRMLLEEAERRTRAAGCRRPTIGVLVANPDAERLYRSVGFEPYVSILTKDL